MTSFEDKVSLMIPAYLRGELSGPERREVETFAAKNPTIAADIAFQKNLKSALKPDEDRFEPGELGWARLSKGMRQEEPVLGEATSKPKFWRYAAAILAVAAIGQAGVLGSIAFRGNDAAQYRTASESPVQAYTIKLGFNPNVTEGQLAETLRSVDAAIIAGPSSLGLYDIQFKSEIACMKGADVFKTNRDIIDTVTACE
ncbi:MAG: zf-HC2 domain-containing protein [Hellea sp.]